MGEAAQAGGSMEMIGEDVLRIPPARAAALERVVESLRDARHVALTTHVNADGDGAGSQGAMASWLMARGIQATIVNPTPFPDLFRFVLPDGASIHHAGTAEARRAIDSADTLLVLDTAEPKRIGRMAAAAAGRRVVVLDHHVAAANGFEGLVLQDAGAAATGELVFDLFRVDGWPTPWPRAARDGTYAALVTDTGSFRFSNTTPRVHAIAASLIAQGVDPETMYRRIYGTVPLRRIQLLRHALEHLEADERWPVTWVSLEYRVFDALGANADDLDGIVEYARSIEGTEVAVLFREVQDGSTKVSLRSNGEIDVNAVARRFGGGGHVKASGAVLGEPLERAKVKVLDAVRDEIARAGMDFRAAPDVG
jgi:bifunctional oligoribonuclease and PAP phosphatase NrnA